MAGSLIKYVKRAAHVYKLHTLPSTPLIQPNISPPNNVQLAQKEDRIALAVQAFKEGYFSSLCTAAQTYDIPESILQGRVKGVVTRYDLRSVNSKLTATEESILVQ
jgi:hypothetical protein